MQVIISRSNTMVKKHNRNTPKLKKVHVFGLVVGSSFFFFLPVFGLSVLTFPSIKNIQTKHRSPRERNYYPLEQEK